MQHPVVRGHVPVIAVVPVVLLVTLLALTLSGCGRIAPTAGTRAAPGHSTNRSPASTSIAAQSSCSCRCSGAKTPIQRSLEASELAILTGYPDDDRSIWVDASRQVHRGIRLGLSEDGETGCTACRCGGANRHRLVHRGTGAGSPHAGGNDFDPRRLPTSNLVKHLLNVARAVERIYARQKGVFGLEAKIAAERPGEPHAVPPQSVTVLRSAQDRERGGLQCAHAEAPAYRRAVSRRHPERSEILRRAGEGAQRRRS